MTSGDELHELLERERRVTRQETLLEVLEVVREGWQDTYRRVWTRMGLEHAPTLETRDTSMDIPRREVDRG
jgi:hypothetical protein